MALVKNVPTEVFLDDVFGYKACEGYYSDKRLLDDRVRGGFFADGEKFVLGSFYSKWHSDYKKLIDAYLSDKTLNEDLLDVYCSGSYYDMLRLRSGSIRLPSYNDGVWVDMWGKPSPNIVFNSEWVQFTCSELPGHMQKVIGHLAVACLFSSVHSLYRKKLLAGHCLRCEKLFLVNPSGSKPQYCGKICRDVAAVYRSRARKREEKRVAMG